MYKETFNLDLTVINNKCDIKNKHTLINDTIMQQTNLASSLFAKILWGPLTTFWRPSGGP